MASSPTLAFFGIEDEDVGLDGVARRLHKEAQSGPLLLVDWV
jgi:hypothetical protein